MNERIKYPRTFHLPFSPGAAADDKMLSDCSIFNDEEVVVTVKMDGECSTVYSDGYIHARSIDGKNHISRDWLKNYLASRSNNIPTDWRLCGENVYAKHSIHYKDLDSYFYLFSVWNERNWCASWEETCVWGELLDLKVVPELYRGIWDEEFIKNLHQSIYGNDECEGFVVRLARSFPYKNFGKSVAKYVRQSHVQTSEHWMQEKVIKNELRNID